MRLRVLNNFLMNKTFDKRIKETVFLGLLNVALPTFYVYSDLAVSIHFFRGNKKNLINVMSCTRISQTASNATTTTAFQPQT